MLDSLQSPAPLFIVISLWSSRHRTATSRQVINWCCAVALALAITSTPVLAQVPPCESALTEAEDLYVGLAFAEAERLVRACLAQSAISNDEALRAYRLLALLHLRQDELSEAKQAVLRLLGISFEYEPDPVQEPPAYVALVASVKDQLRVEQVVPSDSVRVASVPPQGDASEDAGTPPVQIVRTPPTPPEDDLPEIGRPAPQKNTGVRRWLLIGGGVLAAGLAAVLLTSGDPPSGSTGTNPLPPPPAFPR